MIKYELFCSHTPATNSLFGIFGFWFNLKLLLNQFDDDQQHFSPECDSFLFMLSSLLSVCF